MLTIENPVNTSLQSLAVPASKTTQALYDSRVLEAMKTQYRVDLQVKFLHLQAETESLFQQLKAIQRKREIIAAPTLEEALMR
jgi:hypothetical protein